MEIPFFYINRKAIFRESRLAFEVEILDVKEENEYVKIYLKPTSQFHAIKQSEWSFIDGFFNGEDIFVLTYLNDKSVASVSEYKFYMLYVNAYLYFDSNIIDAFLSQNTRFLLR